MKNKSKDKKQTNNKSQVKKEEEEEIPDPIDYDLEDEIHSIAIEIIKLYKSGKRLKDIFNIYFQNVIEKKEKF